MVVVNVNGRDEPTLVESDSCCSSTGVQFNVEHRVGVMLLVVSSSGLDVVTEQLEMDSESDDREKWEDE